MYKRGNGKVSWSVEFGLERGEGGTVRDRVERLRLTFVDNTLKSCPKAVSKLSSASRCIISKQWAQHDAH